ncbi:hypothetical protein SmJEL517_g00326 [Synchytrium microbalum]|uniref:Uncharacterized protein n=1 Tax=Synchytrium microbalum TaxID=1806994 RepID=A0A507CJR8_9FUNG|nr:uncharacterized protein SmJEL517_g00326 [Synchytrium microbalum]TPX38013.1 hypothetical protein SmJEL517_g00326 [Synchytrium microbalum]
MSQQYTAVASTEQSLENESNDETTVLFRTSTEEASTSSAPHQRITENDGVFANLAAKPDAPSKAFQEFEPPSYAEATFDPAPAYLDTTVMSHEYGDDGIMVEGMPVGNFFAFFINLMVSMSFDFIGFLLTSLMSTSHAAKCGSRSGLGITLIRYGFLLKNKAMQDESDFYDPSSLDDMDEEEIARQNEFLSYILIVVGFFVLLRANGEYVRIRRMEAAILSSSASILV